MAKGIDIAIGRVITRFNSKLWTGVSDKNFYGRIFRNQRQGEVVPERFVSGNEYSDTLLNDFKSVTCFFDVQPEETWQGNFTAEVWVLFSLNLLKVYPSVTTERATEYAHEDVVNQIKRVGGWNVNGIVRGLEAFSEYAFVKPEDNMQPYYLFRVNCSVKYPLNC